MTNSTVFSYDDLFMTIMGIAIVALIVGFDIYWMHKTFKNKMSKFSKGTAITLLVSTITALIYTADCIFHFASTGSKAALIAALGYIGMALIPICLFIGFTIWFTNGEKCQSESN